MKQDGIDKKWLEGNNKIMIQTKFFSADTQINLEKAVNAFILSRNIINISYTIAPSKLVVKNNIASIQDVIDYKHCCCVMYEE